MRIVADTNTVVSGLLWSGPPQQIIQAARTGRLQLYSSLPLVAEFAEVIGRVQFAAPIRAAGLSSAQLVAGCGSPRRSRRCSRATSAGACMKRSELEHLIRAAGANADDRLIVVIGSQAVLGQFPRAPAALLVSMEAALYPRNRPERADLIDGAIGEGSSFHEQFGYYAQGVGEATATLPQGWPERLVRIANPNTAGVEGLCLEVHDLAISKYVAGRERDLAFTTELARHGMTRRETLLVRAARTRLPPQLRKLVEGRINRDFRGR